MANYEKIISTTNAQNPQFVKKPTMEAKLEGKLDEMLEDLKGKNNKECAERGSFTSYMTYFNTKYDIQG